MSRESYFTANNFSNAKIVLEGSRVFTGALDAIDDSIDCGKILCCKNGDQLIAQGERDKDVYIVLEGQFDILVNGRGVSTRGAAEVLGEMSVVDPTSKRSASVFALENSVLFHLSDEAFCQVANKHPRVWRNIAAEIATRLRQRGELVDAKGSAPRLFIGSSGEYLDVAHAIQKGLIRTEIIVNVWNQDCFRPSSGTLSSLEAEATKCDLALLLFGNEDLTESRGSQSVSPRDNVVFELGLFMGRLTSKRVFFAKEIDIQLKMPSDLGGITPIEYRRKSGEDLSVSIQPICVEIKRIADELGTK